VPPRNPTPKERFQQVGTFMKRHHDLVDNEMFNTSTDFAMLQYQAQVGRQITDANSAMLAGLKLQGALEFLGVLKNLGETTVLPPRRPDDNLKY
jgi:hypothetical protein